MQDNKSNKKKRIRFTWKILIIIIAVFAVLYAASYLVDAIRKDPNFAIRHSTKQIKLDEKVTVKYKSGRMYLNNRTYIPVMSFTPVESTSYTVTLSDIKSDEGVYVKLTVMDGKLSDYINADNITGTKKNEGPKDTISGSALLNKGKKYYLIIDVVQEAKLDSFSGSFDVTVTRTPEEEGPQEIKAGETINISIDPGENSSVLFRPDETGYYRFETTITGKKAGSGASGIESVITEDGKEKELFGGISYLESGNDYYVIIDTEDTGLKNVKADVSCTQVQQLNAEGHGTIDIEGETIIEYTSSLSEITAIWSESDGDPNTTVYDQNGVPVSTDNNSGEVFSGNRKDFALVFEAQRYKKYRIFIGGDFDKCSISIATYTGDGTTLGPDTVSMDSEEEPGDIETSLTEEEAAISEDEQGIESSIDEETGE